MPGPTTAVRRRLGRPTLALALPSLALALLALGCSSGGSSAAGDPPGAAGQEPAPGGDDTSGFWVDPDSPAARQVREWAESGRSADAETVRRIADRPLAFWAPGHGDPGPEVRRVTEAATADDRTAVLVAYNIPHRDCGQYSEGGAASDAAYREWIDAVADGIGDAEAVVVLEPDALPHTLDGCTAPMYVEDRYTLLAEAVDRLAEQPGTRVYLDAGNPDWVTDVGRLAEALRASGVERAAGFALNVANFQTTERSTAYGRELSGLLDGAHFVIDTSRNGNGPWEEGGDERWCNPPDRALGTPPTTETDDPLVDAYLWVKRPGESDGECRGGPEAGRWWPEYALGLAERATR
ncbi:glycoside hydrolase family 6 protein [Streptomyces sp. DSM 44915]|uniref:Glucanase n=1 Tax=Streptomyces chisholmiae TaxID=3075540 RepID=A0ABU2JI78_9ACTN|nr:glycoside hydrolase family 6 protein [Streptomyces sp. DSM 44915]MDT0264692.1 glycoside hydrolase family 6 protein [Streptomyces sp. DSM 44915]